MVLWAQETEIFPGFEPRLPYIWAIGPISLSSARFAHIWAAAYKFQIFFPLQEKGKPLVGGNVQIRPGVGFPRVVENKRVPGTVYGRFVESIAKHAK
jgi:hypothetical protein